MAIKSFYQQKLKTKDFEVKYNEETGRIYISKYSQIPYITYMSNTLAIEPKDFEKIKELIEQLDVMQKDKK